MSIQLSNGQRLVYQMDESGFYVGETTADPDPQHAGSWLIPARCVEIKPPVIPRDKAAQWSGYKWKIISM